MARIITIPELANVLENMDKHQFVGIKSCTIPKLNKTGRVTHQSIQGKLGIDPANIVKLSSFVAGAGFSYLDGIRNKLLAEGKAPESYIEGTSWHVPYGETKTIKQHPKTQELYAYLFCSYANNPPESRFVDKSTGKEVSKDDLAEFLPPEREPTNQGVDDPVIVRTFKLSSIKELSAAGEVYTVVA